VPFHPGLDNEVNAADLGFTDTCAYMPNRHNPPARLLGEIGLEFIVNVGCGADDVRRVLSARTNKNVSTGGL